MQITYSKSTNLRDLLIKGTLQQTQPLWDKNFVVDQDVRLASMLHDTTVIKSSDKVYKARSHLTCQSNNLVYVVTYAVCETQYLGKKLKTLWI